MANRFARVAVASLALIGACVRDKAELNTEDPSCADGLVACDGRCVDVALDRDNCGSCQSACPPDQVCSVSMCGFECFGGTLRCGDACVDSAIDPLNCGSCNNACTIGTCDHGACACANGAQDGDETDVDCGGTCEACGEGKHCIDTGDCVTGLRCNNGVCVSVTPPLDAALVGFWRFEGDAVDSSTHGNDGTVVNAMPVEGKVGSAYLITDGACIVVPDSTSLDMTGGSALTAMAWIRYAGACADDRGLVLNKETAYEIGVVCTTNILQEAIQIQGATGWTWNGTAVMPIDAWRHIAIVWDGTTVLHYVDGAAVFNRPQAGTLPDKATGLGIGCRDVPPDGSATTIRSFFTGAIDEVALYSRALTATEIQTYYDLSK